MQPKDTSLLLRPDNRQKIFRFVETSNPSPRIVFSGKIL